MGRKLSILITGGNGYVARKLVTGLSDYKVEVITRADVDLTDENACRTFFYNKAYDVVIHTAIEGGSRLRDDSTKVLENNIKMYFNLMSYAAKHAKFINFGSGAEKGYPTDPYGLSKRVIAQSILDKPNSYNIRIYAVFDHNELDTRFIKANIKRYLEKEVMIIHQNKYMDFFYMEDLVSTVKCYIEEEGLPKEFDCTYSETKTLLEISEIINHLDKHRVGISVLKDELDKSYIGSWSGLSQPYIGLEQGIINTYNILKSQL